MGTPYEKQHLSYEAQLERLQSRGMHVENEAEAIRTLRAVGYYRLSAYSHPFRLKKPGGRPGHDERLDAFRAGTSFEGVSALWQFDRTLRLHLLDGLETFEVALRTSLAYHAGKKSPFVHLTPECLDPEFVKQPDTSNPHRMSRYDRWLMDYLHRVGAASGEAFVKWFEEKYEAKLPIWAAVEVLQMGQLATLYKGLELGDRSSIADDFGLTPKVFGSAISAFNGIRNICAHHSRLWNRTLVISPGRPKLGVAPVLDHLHQLNGWQLKRLYTPLAELAWLLEVRTGDASWKGETRRIVSSFPDVMDAGPATMGFPQEWQTLELWME